MSYKKFTFEAVLLGISVNYPEPLKIHKEKGLE